MNSALHPSPQPTPLGPRIAIVGSGIAGLYTAWALSQRLPQAQLHVFEAGDHWGGHTDTHRLVQPEGPPVAVDTGFIVFNRLNYPLFSAMLDQLGVTAQASDMSFSVADHVHGLTYNPSKQWSLLARPQNFARPEFRQMLRDLWRFYQTLQYCPAETIPIQQTLSDYLDRHGYSQAFRELHLYPMCGALWSASHLQTAALPLRFVVQFMQHHRMLQVRERPQWLTVRGGSQQYVQAIRQQCPQIHWHPLAVQQVWRQSTDAGLRVQVRTAAQLFDMDEVVLACHADDALKLLAQPSIQEQQVLGALGYSDNRMVLHSDPAYMPRQRHQWASWHVRIDRGTTQPCYSITYWMNRLQALPTRTPFLATLNPSADIDPRRVRVERAYRHPRFDVAALQAQGRWSRINAQAGVSFAGAYWGWGFHEDGARSAERVVQALCARYHTALLDRHP